MRRAVRVGEILRMAFRDVASHPLRAALSISSFASAVAITVVLAAAGNGLEGAVRGLLRSLGDGQIAVTPGRTTGIGGQRRSGRQVVLRYDDVESLADELPSFEGVAPYFNVYGGGTASRRYSIPWSPARAVSFDYLGVRGAPVIDGRWFSPVECAEGRWVAVLNHGLRRVLYPDGHPIGDWIEWRGRRLEVVGVIQDEAEFPYLLYVPYPAARQIGDARNITGLMARPRGDADWDQAQRELRRVLGGLGGFDPGDTSALEVEDNRDFTTRVAAGTRALEILVVTIAAVCLLLGALGVANMMVISVTERIREIGLRMAVGATSRDIFLQVFFETMVLFAVAGLVGVALGAAACGQVGELRISAERAARLEFDPAVAIASLAALSIVGMVAAMLPARRAARLPAAEALRWQ